MYISLCFWTCFFQMKEGYILKGKGVVKTAKYLLPFCYYSKNCYSQMQAKGAIVGMGELLTCPKVLSTHNQTLNRKRHLRELDH